MKYLYLISMLIWMLPVTNLQAKSPAVLKQDNQHVKQWNGFFNSLVKIHELNLKKFNIRKLEEQSGYAGQPQFYREVKYFDQKTNNLLGKVQWVQDKADTIHTIEVFFYDKQGRVVRDYLAAYLPEHRNAPIQTLINFHYYNDGLHSFRQFDASGNHIYEQCQGKYFDEQVMVSTEEDDFVTAYGDQQDQTSIETYLACFEMLPKQLGKYRNPYQAEIAQAQIPARKNSEVSLGTREDVDKQIEALSKRLFTNPNNASLYIKRGDAWFHLHDFDKAIDDYNQALKIDKDASQAWFGRGMAYGRVGMIDKGIADLSEFIKRKPNNSRAYTKRGVRYLWKGDRENAEQDFLRAIELDKNNAEANDDLGVIYAQRGELDKAIKHFTATITIDPVYQKGYHNLAMAYHLGGENKKAMQAVDKALELRASARETLLLKSQILVALGQHQQATAIKNEAEFLPEGNWSELAPMK
ncbi:MAG: tetratricopeptide repeat protein [Gammaproteobacteria bacterium]|nr:tetratricopeptide repeat protein [Gammaproteobacteria bacterium]